MFKSIEGHPMHEILTPAFLDSWQKQVSGNYPIFPGEADAQREAVEESINDWDFDENSQSHICKSVYKINVTGTYIVACGNLLGPDKHGFHGFDPTDLQIYPIFGSVGEKVNVAFRVSGDIKHPTNWCFFSEADIPIIRPPSYLQGITASADSLKIANHFVKPLQALLHRYSKSDPDIFREITRVWLEDKVSAKSLVQVGVLIFLLHHLAEAIMADGEFSDEEEEFVFPLTKAVCKSFAKSMGLPEFAELQRDELRDFLDRYWNTDGPFCANQGSDLSWPAIPQLVTDIASSDKCNFDPRPAVLLHDLF